MRAPLVFEVKDLNGNVVPNAAVTVRDRVTGSIVTLYETETAYIPDTNPTIADAAGRVVTWAERGDYTATVTGTGITPYTMPIDSTPSNDSSVDPAWMTTFPYRSSYVAAAETTTSTTYTLLATPDIITDVTIPANSVIGIGAMFLSKGNTTQLGSAAIFVNGQKLKSQGATGVASDILATAGNISTANIYAASALQSLGWNYASSSADEVVENTTGMAYSAAAGSGAAGMLWCWVPDGGIYDFSLQYQAAGLAHTLFVKERRMWIWVLG